MIETEGDTRSAAGRNAAATDDICRILQEEMDFIVSVKKSVVVGSSPIAAILTAAMGRYIKVKAVKAAKLLGTTTMAGAKRAVSNLKVRKAQFVKRIPKFQILRRIGVNTAAMAQASAATAMLYGCECCGIGDSMLEEVRRATAKICVGIGGGKSLDRSLYATDGSKGTVDPAFLAHLNPIIAWATAWWDNWTDSDSLSAAHKEATVRIKRAKASKWSVVKGPATAMVATTERLGWVMDSPHSAIDDLGAKWDFKVDPPAAVKKAVKQSARRWRMQKLAAEVPGLVPNCSDVGAVRIKDTVVIDCTATAISSLAKNRSERKEAPSWQAKFRASLTSALCGGQWTQARKASVPKWDVKDPNCQLCHQERGTLKHRFNCPKTMPQNGWPGVPTETKEGIETIGEKRAEILKLQGLACVRVPASKRYPNGHFRWLSEPPDTSRTDVTWYTDGSSSNPTCPEISRIGFAIAVVSDEGDLVAYGAGIPPSFVNDSGMAETWAVWMTIQLCPRQPRIVTDCKGVLDMARAGTAVATAGSSANARIWNLIAQALDQNVTKLADTLVWMPAHQGTGAIGSRYKSNGTRLSCIDFRANRLVDKLALYSTTQTEQARESEKLVNQVKGAAKVALATLGQVTWTANNCKTTEVDAEGVEKEKVSRDSGDAPPKDFGQKAKKAAAVKPVKDKEVEYTVEEVEKHLELLQRKEAESSTNRGKKRRLEMPTEAQPSLRAKTSRSLAAEKAFLEEQTERLCITAQSQDSQRVSFKSFLAIKVDSTTNLVHAQPAAASSSCSTAPEGKTGPLDRVQVSCKRPRERPVKKAKTESQS